MGDKCAEYWICYVLVFLVNLELAQSSFIISPHLQLINQKHFGWLADFHLNLQQWPLLNMESIQKGCGKNITLSGLRRWRSKCCHACIFLKFWLFQPSILYSNPTLLYLFLMRRQDMLSEISKLSSKESDERNREAK